MLLHMASSQLTPNEVHRFIEWIMQTHTSVHNDLISQQAGYQRQNARGWNTKPMRICGNGFRLFQDQEPVKLTLVWLSKSSEEADRRKPHPWFASPSTSPQGAFGSTHTALPASFSRMCWLRGRSTVQLCQSTSGLDGLIGVGGGWFKYPNICFYSFGIGDWMDEMLRIMFEYDSLCFGQCISYLHEYFREYPTCESCIHHDHKWFGHRVLPLAYPTMHDSDSESEHSPKWRNSQNPQFADRKFWNIEDQIVVGVRFRMC
jgi:hypothetical protein